MFSIFKELGKSCTNCWLGTLRMFEHVGDCSCAHLAFVIIPSTLETLIEISKEFDSAMQAQTNKKKKRKVNKFEILNTSFDCTNCHEMKLQISFFAQFFFHQK